jgi:hypothetical protein
MWENNRMSDTSKFKSVGIGLETYGKLVRISKEEHRSIGQQVSKLVDQEYTNRYGKDVVEIKSKNSVISRGVGSLND